MHGWPWWWRIWCRCATDLLFRFNQRIGCIWFVDHPLSFPLFRRFISHGGFALSSIGVPLCQMLCLHRSTVFRGEYLSVIDVVIRGQGTQGPVVNVPQRTRSLFVWFCLLFRCFKLLLLFWPSGGHRSKKRGDDRKKRTSFEFGFPSCCWSHFTLNGTLVHAWTEHSSVMIVTDYNRWGQEDGRWRPTASHGILAVAASRSFPLCFSFVLGRSGRTRALCATTTSGPATSYLKWNNDLSYWINRNLSRSASVVPVVKLPNSIRCRKEKLFFFSLSLFLRNRFAPSDGEPFDYWSDRKSHFGKSSFVIRRGFWLRYRFP